MIVDRVLSPAIVIKGVALLELLPRLVGLDEVIKTCIRFNFFRRNAMYSLQKNGLSCCQRCVRSLILGIGLLVFGSMNLAAGGGQQSENKAQAGGKPFQGQTVTIAFNQPADSLREDFNIWYDHLKQRARDEYGINLVIEMVSWGDYLNKHLMSVATGQGPDIIQLGSGTPSVVAAAGGLLDLRPYMDKFEGGFDVYFDVGKYYAQYDGKIIALPWGGGGRVTYYNKKYYDAAGLKYPQNNWTWEQFLSDIDKLTKYLGRPAYAVMGTANETTYNFWANIVTDGGKILSPDNKSAAFNDAVGVKSVRKILDLYDKGYTAPSFAESTTDDILLSFMNGDVAVSYGNASWWVDIIKKMGVDDFGIVTMPVGSTGLTTGAVTMSEYGVMSYAKNKDASVAILAMLASPEETITSTVILGWVPFRNDLKDNSAYKKYQFFETFFLNAEKSVMHIPQIANVSTVLSSSTKVLNDIYSRAVTGTRFSDADIKARLDALSTEVNNMLK
jgi:multiple sugar transport system substrate-binding protein